MVDTFIIYPLDPDKAVERFDGSVAVSAFHFRLLVVHAAT